MKRLCVVALGVSLGLSGVGGGVRSAGADEATDAQARAYYDQAQTQYALGQFTKAIDLYKQAYELSKRPSLLFNIAQSYRLAGDPRQAKFFYASYLRAAPEAANREEVEGRMKEMDAEMAKDPGPKPVAPEETTRVETNPALFYGGIGAMGVGAVGVGLGVVFGLKAKGLADDVDAANGAWTDDLEQAEKDGKSANTMSIVMYGVGGTLLVGGAILTYLGRPRTVSERVALTPMLGPDGAGIIVRGSF